ncbi:MAG: hypothetical protein Q9157_008320, partial [Trypethelium eluteriae]
DALDQRRLRRDPAKPAARRHRLGEGVEPDDAAIGVERDIGGHEGVQESVAGGFLLFRGLGGCSWEGRRRGGGGGGGGGRATAAAATAAAATPLGVRGGVLQVPVGIVLDDDDVVFLAQGIDLLASLDAECTGGRVLADASG